MKHQNLIKGQIYKNILDIKIPLMFTGVKHVKNDLGYFSTIAEFTPVKTSTNKNWYNSIAVYTKNFDNKTGNKYIRL
jgi:hypothetical protein